MAQTILSRLNINISREQLAGLQQNLSELQSRRAEVTDQLLVKGYEIGSTALSRAAELSEGVPLIQKRAEDIRKTADVLQQAGQAVQRPAIANYDELNVQQVTESLEGLSTYELGKLRRYEEANKNRVTILREVDRLLEAEQ